MRKIKNSNDSLLRRLLSFLGVVLAAVLVCVSVLTLALNRTVLNEGFMKKQLHDQGVYADVSDAVKDSFDGLYRDSDYRDDQLDRDVDEVMDSCADPDSVEKELNPVIHQVYEGKAPTYRGENYDAESDDSVHAALQEKYPNMSSESISSLIADILTALKKNIDLKDIGRIVKKFPGLFKGHLTLPSILSTGGVVILAILLLILIRERLKWIRVYFLISGVLLLAAAVAGWILLPKDLLLINEAVTGYVYKLLRRLILAVFLTGALRLGISFLLQLLLRRRRRAAV